MTGKTVCDERVERARREALEEAAKVAENLQGSLVYAELHGDDVADAIRALIDKPKDAEKEQG